MREELLPGSVVRTSDFVGLRGFRVVIIEHPKNGSFGPGNKGLSGYLFAFRPGTERGRTIVRFRENPELETRMTRMSAIIPPEKPFEATYSDAGGKVATFQIDPRFLADVIRRAGILTSKLQRVPPPGFVINQKVDYLCSLLIQETENGGRLGPLYFENLAVALIVAVFSQTDTRWPDVGNLHVQNEGVQKALAYIQANFRSKLKRAEIAAAAHLSENHFSSLFGRLVGLTPQEYILHCRLRFAEKLLRLRGPTSSIAEVAAEAGFADQAHFTRHFRRFFGRPPQEYRRQYI
jgi:AraC family transcriptional regulator